MTARRPSIATPWPDAQALTTNTTSAIWTERNKADTLRVMTTPSALEGAWESEKYEKRSTSRGAGL
jgi:hypothetical protein